MIKYFVLAFIAAFAVYTAGVYLWHFLADSEMTFDLGVALTIAIVVGIASIFVATKIRR